MNYKNKQGFIAKPSQIINFYDLNKYDIPMGNVHKSFVENSIEWEIIISYKIISIREKSNLNHFIYNNGTLFESLSKNDNYEIFSIKRLTDNKVFSIGQYIYTKMSSIKDKIIELIIINNEVRIHTDKYKINLESAIEAKILFVSEDGLNIFTGDIIYGVNKEGTIINFKWEEDHHFIKASSNLNITYFYNKKIAIRFSKEICEKIIKEKQNKLNAEKLLSYNDLLKLGILTYKNDVFMDRVVTFINTPQ